MRNAFIGLERALFWTFVFAVFAAVGACLAARAVAHAAAGYDTARESYAIVRVLAPEGPAGMAAAEQALSSSSYVTSAAPMSANRAAALLGQWNGEPVRAEDIPPLRLIEIELGPIPEGVDIGGELTAAMAQGGVTAELVGAPDASSGAGLARRVSAAALYGALAFAAIMALIISLAARSFAARRRELVVTLADLGATRGQAAARVTGEALLTGFYAGLAGAILAGAVAMALLLILFPGLRLETMPRLILPLDLAPLIAAPFAAALAAGLGARAAASVFYARAARLA